MKIIKKITAMMLSIMMVLGMCSVVSAAGTGEGEKGTITIDNAIVGQTYKIYKILDLESYDKDANPGLYSYKLTDDKWKDFFETGAGKDYVTINNGYVEWKAEVKETEAAELAQKALAYAGTKNITATKDSTVVEGSTSVEFTDLDLGYYLVDSTAGTLCGLDTTNPDKIIAEKNGKPTVEKKIDIITNENETLVEKSSANLGEEVFFKTTIKVEPGVYNYVLHDKMNSNLVFQTIMAVADNGTDNGAAKYNYVSDRSFQLITNPTGDGCTFELKFLDDFYENRAELINQRKVTTITVQYYAIVKDTAPINTAMENKAWLTYGDNSTKSNESITNTYTYGIPVFKHTGTGENKKALAGAEFKLYTDAECTDALKFTKNVDNKYRYDETNGNTTLTSLADGMINIEGIKEGTYYLKETKAPKGYNLLKDTIAITIDADGNIKTSKTGETTVTRVDVQNNAGSILPSTGGIGTTIFYIAGALLVLISGVVLIAKKRTDSK